MERSIRKISIRFIITTVNHNNLFVGLLQLLSRRSYFTAFFFIQHFIIWILCITILFYFFKNSPPILLCLQLSDNLFQLQETIYIYTCLQAYELCSLSLLRHKNNRMRMVKVFGRLLYYRNQINLILVLLK